MDFKKGSTVSSSDYGLFQLNYEIQSFQELIDHLAVREFIFAKGIILKCSYIKEWTFNRIEKYISDGLFWDVKQL